MNKCKLCPLCRGNKLKNEKILCTLCKGDGLVMGEYRLGSGFNHGCEECLHRAIMLNCPGGCGVILSCAGGTTWEEAVSSIQSLISQTKSMDAMTALELWRLCEESESRHASSVHPEKPYIAWRDYCLLLGWTLHENPAASEEQSLHLFTRKYRSTLLDSAKNDKVAESCINSLLLLKKSRAKIDSEKEKIETNKKPKQKLWLAKNKDGQVFLFDSDEARDAHCSHSDCDPCDENYKEIRFWNREDGKGLMM